MTTLELDSTPADVLAIAEHVGGTELRRSLVIRAALAAVAAVCAACLVALLDAPAPWPAVFAALAGLGPVAVVLGGRAVFRAAVTKAAVGSGVIGRRRLTLEGDGLRATHAFGETFLRWSAMGPVVRTERHLFVMAGTKLGIPIPRSAFATPEEAEAFAAELERRLDGTLARDRLPTG
jgi:hypothetical protein